VFLLVFATTAWLHDVALYTRKSKGTRNHTRKNTEKGEPCQWPPHSLNSAASGLQKDDETHLEK
jgi:hypothetical protein